MTYETFVKIGVDLIAPAVTIFTIGYAFLPWHSNHIGRALMAHSFGSMLLFDVAVMTQNGVISENYPGNHVVTLTILILWIIGWWYLALALPWKRWWLWWKTRPWKWWPSFKRG